MTQTIELPLWLLILILLFAAVTASTHLLFPSVRWFFRRRAERVVAKLNERLKVPIQPFKLLRRQDMIQRVIYDPDVIRAVQAYAEEEGVREDVAFEKAHSYAREIVPSFSASAYFGVAIRFGRWLSTFLFDVRLHQIDETALDGIEPNATVVFVINHRSNFDYVLVTYLAATQSALSYAVGEWARVWPLSRLIRAMGAYFIRRKSRNDLYRKVLSTYVQRATEAGVTQAVFPEGGLSRDGQIGAPKLGIFSYIVDGWRRDGHDVIFVPVALNYDRVVEDRILVAAHREPEHRFKASAPEAIRFTLRYLRRRIQRKVGRFGVASVTFGRPVSLTAAAAEGEDGLVKRLATRLTDDIRAAVPFVTTPCVLAAIYAEGGTATEDAIARGLDRIATESDGAPVNDIISPDDRDALRHLLEVLVLRRILTRDGESYTIAAPDLAIYYVNSIRHHLSASAAEALPPVQSLGSFGEQ